MISKFIICSIFLSLFIISTELRAAQEKTVVSIALIDFLYLSQEENEKIIKNIEKDILIPAIDRNLKLVGVQDYKIQIKRVTSAHFSYFTLSTGEKQVSEIDYDLAVWGQVDPSDKKLQNYILQLIVFTDRRKYPPCIFYYELEIKESRIIRWKNIPCNLPETGIAVIPTILAYKLPFFRKENQNAIPIIAKDITPVSGFSSQNRFGKNKFYSLEDNTQHFENVDNNIQNKLLPLVGGDLPTKELLGWQPHQSCDSLEFFGSLQLDLENDGFLFFNLPSSLYQSLNHNAAYGKKFNYEIDKIYRPKDSNKSPIQKARIAVVDFQIKVEQAHKELGTAMSELLIDALVETRRYSIVERSALQTVRQEQIMALSGEVDAATGAEVGKLLGAEYLVVGVVSKFEENTGGGGLGGLVGGKALSGVGFYTSELGVTIRIINATTGEIVATEKIGQKESEIGLVAVTATQSGAAGSFLYKSKSMQTALEKAVIRAVEVIGDQIPGGEEPAITDATGVMTVDLTAKNLDFTTSRLLAKTLEKIDGVQDVKSAFEGKTANIKVKYHGAAEDFADALLATEIPGFKLQIESLTAKKIVMKVDKK